MHKTEKEMLYSILSFRDWENILKEFNSTLDSKYFTDRKAKLFFDIIVETEGNVYEMKQNAQLKAERIDMFQPFPNTDLLTVVDAFDNLRVKYNKDRYNEIMADGIYNITDGGELNSVFLNMQDQLGKIIIEETDNIISLSDYSKQVEQEDLKRTDEVIGYKLNKFSDIEEATAGIQAGLIIISGNPNAGKSILIQNLEIDLLKSNDNLHILKISLDDSKRDCVYTLKAICSNGTLTRNDIKRIRFIKGKQRYRTSFKSAGAGIGSYNKTDKIEYKNSTRYQTTYNVIKEVNAEDEYNKANNSFNEDISNRMTIIGQEDLKDYNHLENMLRKYLKNNKKKLVVTIDGIMNLDISRNIIGTDLNSMHDTRANLLKRLADIYDIPLIVTTEVRKVEGFGGKFREPTENDIKYSNKYLFNAKLIMLISHNKDAWEQNQVYNKLIIPKNKFTGLRNSYYFELKREEADMTFDNWNNHNKYYCKFLYENSISKTKEKED